MSTLSYRLRSVLRFLDNRTLRNLNSENPYETPYSGQLNQTNNSPRVF